MENSPLPPTSPATVNRTVLRRPNAELSTREHLTTERLSGSSKWRGPIGPEVGTRS